MASLKMLKNSLASTMLLSVALGSSACSTPEAAARSGEEHAPVDVTTTRVAERSMPRTLQLTGTILANRSADVAATGAGEVLAVTVERGDFVRRGVVLARLDARSAALQQRRAHAVAAVARVEQDNSRLECERSERLFSERVISHAEYDRQRASCEAAALSADAARAGERLAATVVADSVVRAPFSGLIVERQIEIGEYVQPGRTVATIVEIDPLRLELSVPESMAPIIREGDEVRFSVAAFPEENFVGKIRFVGPVVRRFSRDLVVEALVDNKDQRLRPGMFATSRLPAGEYKAPSIPVRALMTSGEDARVFVVQNRRIQERIVHIGAENDGQVAVTKGLKPGEEVVVAPTSAVKDGVIVK